MEKIKEVVKKHRVLMGIAIGALLVVFYADTWQQNRFAIADKAYMMMNKQEYTEAAGLMEQYLDISWQPYWKAIELVNGKSDKFTRAEAETALERCMEKIKEE